MNFFFFKSLFFCSCFERFEEKRRIIFHGIFFSLRQKRVEILDDQMNLGFHSFIWKSRIWIGDQKGNRSTLKPLCFLSKKARKNEKIMAKINLNQWNSCKRKHRTRRRRTEQDLAWFQNESKTNQRLSTLCWLRWRRRWRSQLNRDSNDLLESHQHIPISKTCWNRSKMWNHSHSSTSK